MVRIKAWIFTPQMIICYALLVAILAFEMKPSTHYDMDKDGVVRQYEEPTGYYNENPVETFRAIYMIKVFGKLTQFDETIHIIEVEIGHKTGDVVALDDMYYKLLEPIGEGGDILSVPVTMKIHAPNYYYGEIIYPDYVQDDTLIVIKPKLLNALMKQAVTDGEIAHALSLTTRKY